MKAKKKERLNLKSELHAICPQPIERVLQRLRDLESQQVKIILDDQDGLYQFRVEHYREDKVNASVSGYVRRWLGTETRIDANGRNHLPEWQDFLVQGSILAGLTVVYMGMAGFCALLTLSGLRSIDFFILLVISIGAALFTWSIMPEVNFQAEQRSQALRDVDSMMQQIADAITDTSAPLLEFDGDESSLSNLLAQRDTNDTASSLQ